MRSLLGVSLAIILALCLSVAVLPTHPAIAAFGEAKLLASDGAADDRFGHSVAISGDTAVVGAYYDGDNGAYSGSAYVYVRSGGSWSQQAKLLASDGAAGDYFGISVAISGDTAVVGARWGDGSGSAYVFVRSGGSWSQQAKLLASDGAAWDEFGWSVSISGDTAVVGARLDDDNGANSGSAYVFVRSGGSWSQQAKLLASDGAAGDYFGYSVSISGNTAVVGAVWDEDNGYRSGSAYVFVRSGGSWSQQVKLLASDGAARDNFGHSVSISGDTALIGAWGDEDNGYQSGSAYVFVRSGGSWSQQAKLLASDGGFSDRFGYSVSISGDTTMMGATGDRDNGQWSGSAYVFVRSGGSWSQQTKLLASDGAPFDHFGWSVSISEDTAVVGAPLDDDNGSLSGSAYVYQLNQPPTCSGAYADPVCLWPPNHKFVNVSIKGVTDPEGDLVTITITAITSDEPTASDKGSGGAKHAPDADGIGTNTASVRAERSGDGDGRVYVIHFTASDDKGGESEGTVKVKVPHDQSPRDCSAKDSGQNYDATQIN